MNSGPNWARRYGPNHRRLCARPGCGAPAAATLRFQPTEREAWLVDLDDDAVRTEGDLCARHAAGLVLPRGWELHNDLSAGRDETTRPAPPARRARGASVARARRRRAATGTMELPGLAAVARDPEPGTGWAPVGAPARRTGRRTYARSAKPEAAARARPRPSSRKRAKRPTSRWRKPSTPRLPLLKRAVPQRRAPRRQFLIATPQRRGARGASHVRGHDRHEEARSRRARASPSAVRRDRRACRRVAARPPCRGSRTR